MGRHSPHRSPRCWRIPSPALTARRRRARRRPARRRRSDRRPAPIARRRSRRCRPTPQRLSPDGLAHGVEEEFPCVDRVAPENDTLRIEHVDEVDDTIAKMLGVLDYQPRRLWLSPARRSKDRTGAGGDIRRIVLASAAERASRPPRSTHAGSLSPAAEYASRSR